MEPFTIRPITPADAPAVARVIRTVMPEFGAVGPGFAIQDPEVDAMFAAYAPARHAFLVVESNGEVVGGAGYGPLPGAEPTVCELRKMYVYASARGYGIGRELLTRLLVGARADGFETCYLETLAGMDRAAVLYDKLGFKDLDAPLGDTGHCSCDRYMARAL